MNDGARLAAAIRQIVLTVERYRLQAARTAFGVGDTEMEALSQLFVTESSTPTELARHLHLTTPSVTDLVDRLVSGGLVVRSSHPTDRRKIVVTLSATARSKMEDMFAVVTDVTLRATETLTPAERTIVIDCLASVSDAYEETIAAMTAGPGDRFAAHIASPAAVPPGPP